MKLNLTVKVQSKYAVFSTCFLCDLACIIGIGINLLQSYRCHAVQSRKLFLLYFVKYSQHQKIFQIKLVDLNENVRNFCTSNVFFGEGLKFCWNFKKCLHSDMKQN
jgi:hypothetical protein